MVNKRILLTIWALPLLLAACSKEQEVRPKASGEPVRFAVSGEIAFKAGDSAFEENDEFGISAGTPISVANKRYIVNSSSAVVPYDDDNEILWGENQTSASDFTAYYPYQSGASNPTSFTIQADQTGSGFTGSDLMFASCSSRPSDGSVNLVFSHKLVKLIVSITNNLSSGVTGVRISGTRPTIAFNASTGVVSTPSGTATTISAHYESTTGGSNGGNGAVVQYAAILVPQTATPTIEVTVLGGNVFTYTVGSSTSFTGGQTATAAITLNRDDLSYAAATSVSMSSWGSNSDVELGDAVVSQPSNSWSIVGDIMGSDWNDNDKHEDLVLVKTQVESADNNWTPIWSREIYYTPGQQFLFRFNRSWDNANVISAKNSGTTSLTVGGTAVDLKYKSFTEGGGTGGKNMTINTSTAGWYRIELYPYWEDDASGRWPQVKVYKID